MVDVIALAAYKESSEGEDDMADKITVVATKSETVITRLVTGVELALKQSGKHWTLTAKPEKNK
jgi:hypothetical protein